MDKLYESTDDTLACGQFVYCLQHLRVHNTGWCTVDVLNKIPLVSKTKQEADEEWKLKEPMILSFSQRRIS